MYFDYQRTEFIPSERKKNSSREKIKFLSRGIYLKPKSRLLYFKPAASITASTAIDIPSIFLPPAVAK